MLDPMGVVTDRLGWLKNEMDQLFGQFFPEVSGQGTAYPALNLWEDEGHFFAEAELPGFSIKDLEISVAGNALTIKGERKAEETKDGFWLRRERVFGPFTRTVEFSRPIDPDKVEASFKHGVLTVTLPKAETARPRKIEVKASSK